MIDSCGIVYVLAGHGGSQGSWGKYRFIYLKCTIYWMHYPVQPEGCTIVLVGYFMK